MKITNSLSGQKQDFAPRVTGHVSVYACGPTTYHFIHIGNLRAAMVADLFVRYFRYAGMKVTFVRNYTDVDDKIINEAAKVGMTPEALSEKFTREAELDYSAAGLLDPDHKPRVTSTMPEIIAMVQTLIDRKNAYVAEDGEVLFEIDSFKDYGKLSRKNLEDLQAGARVEVSAKKKSPMDFTLWKPAKPGEPSWDSPWGKGRPGWHIECSAMAKKHLGDQIDIHFGGEDLIFPHHENEIAQSECANGCAPFSKYWAHNAFLTLSKEKMSKSLGNVFLARDFLTRYSGEVARYLLLSSHYRSVLDFSRDVLDTSLSGLQRIYEAKEKAVELKSAKVGMPDLRAESAWGEFVASAELAKREIRAAYDDDLNTPAALGALFVMIREWNRTLTIPHALHTPTAILGAEAFLEVLEHHVGSVLGVGRLRPEKMIQDLQRIRREELERSGGMGTEGVVSETEIQLAILARKEARAAKNFAEGDRIRKELEARGVVLKDSPQGTSWEYKKL